MILPTSSPNLGDIQAHGSQHCSQAWLSVLSRIPQPINPLLWTCGDKGVEVGWEC